MASGIGRRSKPQYRRPMANHIRHGYGAVRPYLYGDQSSLDLAAALGGEVIENAHGHVEIKLGDSMIVIEFRPNWGPEKPRQSIYVYVPDVDAAHAAAVRAGATSVEATKDKRYQERSGTLRDGVGNTWYVSTYTG
jgi:PhnB protein